MTSRSDFAEIAARAAAWADDVRACLILSADGLTLGAFPAEQEAAARDVWSRLAGTGHPARGFLEFGTETWACVRRGGYSGVLIASVGADRKSTRLNSSHVAISYAVFCLKKKNNS